MDTVSSLSFVVVLKGLKDRRVCESSNVFEFCSFAYYWLQIRAEHGFYSTKFPRAISMRDVSYGYLSRVSNGKLSNGSRAQQRHLFALATFYTRLHELLITYN